MNMCVIVDMIHAVAVVAVTLGTVAKFQFRVFRICSPADCAFVAVQGLRSLFLIVFRPIDIGALLVSEAASGFHEVRQYMQNICAEEQEVVKQSEHGEEPQADHINDSQNEIEPRQILHFDGDDEHQKHLIFRVNGSKSQQKAQVQIAGRGIDSEEQRGNVCDDHAAQVKQVEPQRSPTAFDSSADDVVKIHGNGKK